MLRLGLMLKMQRLGLMLKMQRVGLMRKMLIDATANVTLDSHPRLKVTYLR